MKGSGEVSRSESVEPVNKNAFNESKKRDYESISDASFDDMPQDTSLQEQSRNNTD